MIISDFGKKSVSSLFKTYHLSVDDDNWLEIYHDGKIANVIFKSIKKEGPVHFNIEIDTGSSFFENLMEVINDIQKDD
jgi:hypothetical protein